MPNAALVTDPESTPDENGTNKEKPLVPFVRSSRERTEEADDTTTTMTTSSQSVGPVDIPAIGYFRHLVLEVDATGADAGTASAAFDEDGPFNVLSDLQIADVNGNPIFGPMNGYLAYLSEKYGAYTNITDARNKPSFSTTTGTGSGGGNFNFTVRIPIEISGRDGFGSLANMNASQTYKLRYSIAADSTVYTTSPATTLPDVRVRAWLEAWAQPRETDARGNPQATQPPAHGATQRWSTSTYTLNSGEQVTRFTQVGNLIRTLVCVWDEAGTRNTANFPDPIRLEYDGSLIEAIGQDVFRDRMAERYGFTAAAEAANGLDTGVFVWDFTHDLDGKPGFEMRDLYLPTTQATRLDLRGNFGASGTLTVLTNDVAVPTGQGV